MLFKDGETKVINRIEYERYPLIVVDENYSGMFWQPTHPNYNQPVVCNCDSTEVRIICSDAYETTGECTKCGLRDVVHSG